MNRAVLDKFALVGIEAEIAQHQAKLTQLETLRRPTLEQWQACQDCTTVEPGSACSGQQADEGLLGWQAEGVGSWADGRF